MAMDDRYNRSDFGRQDRYQDFDHRDRGRYQDDMMMDRRDNSRGMGGNRDGQVRSRPEEVSVQQKQTLGISAGRIEFCPSPSAALL